jgi:hypothetical protein
MDVLIWTSDESSMATNGKNRGHDGYDGDAICVWKCSSCDNGDEDGGGGVSVNVDIGFERAIEDT